MYICRSLRSYSHSCRSCTHSRPPLSRWPSRSRWGPAPCRRRTLQQGTYQPPAGHILISLLTPTPTNPVGKTAVSLETLQVRQLGPQLALGKGDHFAVATITVNVPGAEKRFWEEIFWKKGYSEKSDKEYCPLLQLFKKMFIKCQLFMVLGEMSKYDTWNPDLSSGRFVLLTVNLAPDCFFNPTLLYCTCKYWKLKIYYLRHKKLFILSLKALKR